MKRNRQSETNSYHKHSRFKKSNDGNKLRVKGKKQDASEQEKIWRFRQIGLLPENIDNANAIWSEYYKQFFDDESWRAFTTSMSCSLPITFRLDTNLLVSRCTHQWILNFAQSLLDTTQRTIGKKGGDEEKISPERCLSPAQSLGSIWKVGVDKNGLRRNKAMQPLNVLLTREMTVGHLSRQEIVSMVPSLLLDVQSNHSVLDMCAAPGSKSRHILALMRACSKSSVSVSSVSSSASSSSSTNGPPLLHEPTGVLVVNDSDIKRTRAIVKQMDDGNGSALGSPAVIVSCLRGEDIVESLMQDTSFPGFDRVLCDVPCTGDGTFRKAPDLWRTWSISRGRALHPMQLQLALHAGCLTKTGGKLVYSTCSLNPLENESVVAALLTATNGALELISCNDASHSQLNNLKYTPGLHHWTLPERSEGYFTPSMYPPSKSDAINMHLERCLRLLPHEQDTGGFFVATFMKKCDFDLNTCPAAFPNELKSGKEKLLRLRSLGFIASGPSERDEIETNKNGGSGGSALECFGKPRKEDMLIIDALFGCKTFLKKERFCLMEDRSNDTQESNKRNKNGADDENENIEEDENLIFRMISKQVRDLLKVGTFRQSVLRAGVCVLKKQNGLSNFGHIIDPKTLQNAYQSCFALHAMGVNSILPFVQRNCIQTTSIDFAALVSTIIHEKRLTISMNRCPEILKNTILMQRIVDMSIGENLEKVVSIVVFINHLEGSTGDVIDNRSGSSSSSSSSSSSKSGGNGNGSKRRISKAERKKLAKLAKQNSAPSALPVTSALPAPSATAATTSRDVTTTTMVHTPVIPMSIVLRVLNKGNGSGRICIDSPMLLIECFYNALVTMM